MSPYFVPWPLDLPAPRKLADVIGSAKCERLDGHRRLPAARGHEARTVAEKQIGYIVRAVKLVDHRTGRVIPHTASAKQVNSAARQALRGSISFLRPCRLHDVNAAVLQEHAHGEIVRVIFVRDADCGNAPGVLQHGIDADVVARHRERRAVPGCHH